LNSLHLATFFKHTAVFVAVVIPTCDSGIV
jgi:hypothetical protein